MTTRLQAPKAWITGAGGLIGNYLLSVGGGQKVPWELRPISRNDVDLLDFSSVERLFQIERPSLIIHCAAISKSPACEANPPMARQVNFKLTKFLSDLAADIKFLFFSTDQVFDGKKGNYIEADSKNPWSVYSETKALAEEAVLKNRGHTVIRTSLNGGISPTGDR